MSILFDLQVPFAEALTTWKFPFFAYSSAKMRLFGRVQPKASGMMTTMPLGEPDGAFAI